MINLLQPCPPSSSREKHNGTRSGREISNTAVILALRETSGKILLAHDIHSK